MSEPWCEQPKPQQQPLSLSSDLCNNNNTSGNGDSDLQSPTTHLRLPPQQQDINTSDNNEKDSLEASFHHEVSSTSTPNFLDNPSLTHPHQYPTSFYPTQSYSGGGGGGGLVGEVNTEDASHYKGIQQEYEPYATTTPNGGEYQHHQQQQIINNNKYDRYTSLWATEQHHNTSPTTGFNTPLMFQHPPHYEGGIGSGGYQKYWPSSRFTRRSVVMPKDTPIKITLENKTMIERFDKYCTEMIITKTGRRMFPSPQISIQGMEATQKYFVLFDVTPADDNRYKFHHFNWVIAGKAEPLPPVRFYIHPESPLTGSQWMKQQITFQKVKLTNNTCDQHGHLVLNSMHRYQPRIHVVQASDIYQLQCQMFHTFAFPECQFIAVTAYQNSQITQLKIEHNPFAKGFRKQEKDKREGSKSNDDDQNGTKTKHDDCIDFKKSYLFDQKYGHHQDRKSMNLFDSNIGRWNHFDNQQFNQSAFNTLDRSIVPIDCNNNSNNHSKYDSRDYSPINNSGGFGSEFEKISTPSQNFHQNNEFTQRYNSGFEPIRPFPFVTEQFPPTEYRANGPSFI